MDRVQRKRERRRFAQKRVRKTVVGTAERPRVVVFKSLRYIYVQVIDDEAGRTLVQASSQEAAMRKKLKGSAKTKEAAKLVGETLAERAKAQGIARVVFDRGGYIYHGRVRALAEGAREKGLDF